MFHLYLHGAYRFFIVNQLNNLRLKLSRVGTEININVFSKNLDEGCECTFSKCLDSTSSGQVVSMPGARTDMQKDLDRLKNKKWANVNPIECKHQVLPQRWYHP